jgi:hypothetical protein
MSNDPKNEGWDLVGLGKVAKAIPEEVYSRSTKTLLISFEALIAPLTETTSGFGRYIRQKFDSMVEVEKAIAAYTLERAITRAKAKATPAGIELQPFHSKGFVRALEEASKETDPLLNEMWTNLLTTQIIDCKSHPHFVETLAHFSPAEAQIFISLCSQSEIGENDGAYLGTVYAPHSFWIKDNDDNEKKPWTYSCTLLCEFGFANAFVLTEKKRKELLAITAILCRTPLGEAFLKTVSP